MKTHIKVINLDDHDIVNNGVAGVLQSIPFIVFEGSFKTAEKALSFLKSNQVDVILTDLRFDNSELEGIGFAVKVKQLYPDIKIVAYTTHHSQKAIKEAYAVDIDGYVLKTDNNSELIRAIETVFLEGSVYYSPAIGPIMLGKRFVHSKEVAEILRKISLREMEVLLLIAQEYSVNDIAEKLGVSGETIKKHRNSLFEKISTKKDVDLANFVFRNGLLP